MSDTASAAVLPQGLLATKEEIFGRARAFLVSNWNGFLKVPWTGATWTPKRHPEITEARIILGGLETHVEELHTSDQPLLQLFQALVTGKGEEETRTILLGQMQVMFNDTLGPEGTFQEATKAFSEMLQDAAEWCSSIANTVDVYSIVPTRDTEREKAEAVVLRHRMNPFMRTLQKRATERRLRRNVRAKPTASSTSSGKRKKQDRPAKEQEDDDQTPKRSRQVPASEALEQSTIGSASMMEAETQHSAPLSSNEISHADEEMSQGASEADKPIPLKELAKDAHFLELPVIRRARAFVRRNFPKWRKEQEKYRKFYKMNPVEKRFAELISEELDRHIKKTDDASYSEGFRLLEEYFSALSAAELVGGSIFTVEQTDPIDGVLAGQVYALFSGKDWSQKDAEREDAETFLCLLEEKASPQETDEKREEELSAEARTVVEIKTLSYMGSRLTALSEVEANNERPATTGRTSRATGSVNTRGGPSSAKNAASMISAVVSSSAAQLSDKRT